MKYVIEIENNEAKITLSDDLYFSHIGDTPMDAVLNLISSISDQLYKLSEVSDIYLKDSSIEAKQTLKEFVSPQLP